MISPIWQAQEEEKGKNLPVVREHRLLEKKIPGVERFPRSRGASFIPEIPPAGGSGPEKYLPLDEAAGAINFGEALHLLGG